MKSAKGSAFEREICKELSLWWTDGERDDIFWRSAGSGGRATNRTKKGKSTSGQYGDITATDPLGVPLIKNVTIELKRGYKNWSILDVLDKPPTAKPKVFEDFVSQAMQQAEDAGTKYWWLITQRDRRIPMIFFSLSLYSVLTEYSGHNPTYSALKFKIDSCRDVIQCMGFKDFIEWCNPEGIKHLC